MPLNKYQPQANTHRRTESAILEGTKNLIATVGLAKMSMIEIADISQISRATLYNHFRDKDSVVAALCVSEFSRIIAIANGANNATDALEFLSKEISTDTAIAHMRFHDPAVLTQGLSAINSPLWKELSNALAQITGSQVLADLSLRWLIGQVLNPISAQDSHLQAELLISRTIT